MATLNTVDLGVVQSEEHNIEGGIDVQAMPGSPSSDADGFNFEGVLRTINVTGKYVAADNSALESWINNWDNYTTPSSGLLNGEQLGVQYVSALFNSRSYKVMVATFNYKANLSQPNTVTYAFTLKEVI